jgi:protein-L-isoaspartate O-methyltransferase
MKKITHTPTEAVIDVLRRSTCVGNELMLPEQLDRKLYLEVAKALELLGGKWSRKNKCHVFDAPCGPLVEDIVATGSVIDLQKTYQFFPSPPDVAAQLIELAELKPHMTVLEPSAGDGAIVQQLPIKRLNGVGVSCDFCEPQADKARVCSSRGAIGVADDFLTLPTTLKYDRIIANPPFARGQDVQHVGKMIEHLKPGGRLVTVMSPSWKFRQGYAYDAFKARLEQDDVESHEWFELPATSFRVSGTDVRTGILVVQMKAR